MSIFSREVLRKIESGETGWEGMLPDGIGDLIKDYRLFGYTRKPLKPLALKKRTAKK